MAVAASAAPPPALNTASPAIRPGTEPTASASSAPPRMLVITSGSSIAPNAAPCGSPGSVGTTSRTGALTPAFWPATSVSSCATAGLAAEAVSTSGDEPPTTMAPYARRPAMSCRAWAAPAAGITRNTPGCPREISRATAAAGAAGPATTTGRWRGARRAAGHAKAVTTTNWMTIAPSAMATARVRGAALTGTSNKSGCSFAINPRIAGPRRPCQDERSFYYETMPKVSQEHLERRRQQILDAAASCFARQGFHATSMQDIFASAGLSAGAVYRYFPSKTELIRAIAAEALATVLPVLDSATSDHVTPGVPDVVATLIAELRDGRLARLRPVILQVWAEAVRDEELAELARSTLGQLLANVTQLLERLAAEGRIPSGTDTAAAGRLIMALLQGYVIQLAIFGDVSPQQVREAAAALFGDG